MWAILKVFIEFVIILLLVHVLIFDHKSRVILAPGAGLEPATATLEGAVTIMGPPGKSLKHF